MDINGQTPAYIQAHAHDDVRQLALSGSRDKAVDMSTALEQIRGRQTAARKLPMLARREGIWYPVHLSMEQCSSQEAAAYKLRLVRRLIPPAGRLSMADLTGGFGIDFLALSMAFRQATYIERNEQLCQLVRHNLKVLRRQAQVVYGDGTQALDALPHQTLIYVDPARRAESGARTYAIADCTPDVLALRHRLTAQAQWVIVKLSPMLDWHEAVRQLGCVAQVHIVAVGSECKELLLVLQAGAQGVPDIYCATDGRVCRLEATETGVRMLERRVAPGDWIYEPGAAVMKSGCFGALCRRYGVEMVEANSHLFVADHEIADFPGRRFRVQAVTTLNRRQLRQALQGIDRANITVRHFPIGVADLRRRLRLADGGDTYIYATTTAQHEHILIVCRR